MLAMIANWRGFLDSAIREEELRDFREHACTGRPLGNAMFLEDVVDRYRTVKLLISTDGIL